MTDNGQDHDESVHLVQRFLTADEVYVYKIPPLKNAGGHRAEDWNLAQPLQTCRLLVERRGDFLELDFIINDPSGTHEHQLFCRSKVQAVDGKVPTNFLEQVVDSSRYFVVRIQGDGGKEALIGFGFRDREKATDLREAIQHYERSLSREAASLATFKVPQLAEGETIHVNIKGKSSSSGKPKKTTGRSGGGIPLLSKKPPANPDALIATPVETSSSLPASDKVNPKTIDKVAISIGEIDLDAEHKKNSADHSDTDGSDGAVFTGDEKEWATQFDMK